MDFLLKIHHEHQRQTPKISVKTINDKKESIVVSFHFKRFTALYQKKNESNHSYNNTESINTTPQQEECIDISTKQNQRLYQIVPQKD